MRVPIFAGAALALAALAFTPAPAAAWRATCEVNDRVAPSTRRATGAFTAADAAYLKADWTNRDAAIAAEVSAHGRAGVSLYLVYPTGGGGPKVLPLMLTDRLVAQAIGPFA